MAACETAGACNAWLNTGSGWQQHTGYAPPTPVSHWSGSTNVDLGVRVMDVNGDGLPDWLQCETAGVCAAWINTGDGWQQNNTYAPPTVVSHWSGSTNVDWGVRTPDVNGDGLSDFLQCESVGACKAYTITGPFPDLLTSITNGLTAVTSITYKPITDTSVYTKESSATFPNLDLQAPIYVVSSSTNSDGLGGNYGFSYTYAGARVHLQGGGFLGFRQLVTTDNQTGIKSTTTYRQDYPYQGLPLVTEKRTSGGTLLNRSENTWTDTVYSGVHHISLVTQSVETSYELNGNLVTTVTTNSTYDSYGNPTQITVSTGDGYSKVTNNTYTNNTTNWFLGRLTQASVTSTKPGPTSQTRTSSFAYDSTSGLLTQEVIEPGTALALTTDYVYDAFGNKTSATISGSDIVTRTSSTSYDAQGRFATGSTNALSHSETRVFDAKFGNITSLTGPNSLATTWTYDSLGRKTLETRADSTTTTWTYNICSGSCPTGAKIYTTTQSTGAPTSTVYLDMLGREIRSAVAGFDGTLIYKDTEYDSYGRIYRVSKPYYSGQTKYWTTYAYDVLGRVTQETAPDSSVSTMSYAGLVTSTTNALSQTTTRTKNSQGQLIEVKDTQNNTTQYEYDHFGNLIKTTDAASNITTLTYDIRGRKLTMTDPDMGYWQYQYNVLGELVWQKDAKNQVTTMTYDKLGRMTNRSEPDLISDWTYDTATKGVGKLTQATADNGYARTYTYDSLGRVSRVATVIDTTYNVDTTYDSSGRVQTTTYPTGFAVKNVYNSYGYLSELRNNASNALYWQANSLDALGHVTSETLGNSLTTTRTYNAQTGRIEGINTGTGSAVQNLAYQYDTIGNLSIRQDNNQNLIETFTYDTLNRLTGSSSTQWGTKTIGYNAIGNITSKSDVGTYTYGTRPHAVTQTTGTINATYAYDANGNLTSGNGRTVTYSSYNQVTQIQNSSATLQFVYDSEHARIKQVGPNSTIYYLNANASGVQYEKEVKTGITHYNHYLYAGSQMIGLYVSKSNSTTETKYFHKDHLGSIDTITDASGTVLERLSYDAWGKRRYATGQDDPANAITAQQTHRGFTGHEHLDDVGLIHMNGRVYDPSLARFVSADPFIQFPDSTQGSNRYSYVDNNPLSYTDPTGYLKFKQFARIAAAITAAYFIGVYDGGIFGAKGLFAGAVESKLGIAVANGAIGGFIGGAIQTGTLKGAVHGAFTGGVFGAIGAYGAGAKWGTAAFVAAHATAGCITGAASGGSCGSGALAAGFAKFATLELPGDMSFIVKGITVAVIGGTASALGGGKFENGAYTAAFGYVFNCLASKCNASDYSRSEDNYHEYGPFSTHLCNASDSNCLAAASKVLLCESAPGQDTCVVPGQKAIAQTLTLGNKITQIAVNDRMIINGTSPGHIFNDGYVVRWLTVNGTGDVYIWTYGIGVNSNPFTWYLNQNYGPKIFKDLGSKNAESVKRILQK